MNLGPLSLLIILLVGIEDLEQIKKRVLVSGGAGFVGSNLVRELLKDNSTLVHVIDNLSSGQYKNVEQFLCNKNFKFYSSDVRFTIEQSFDEIYHLASLASPQDFTVKRIDTLLANFEGAHTLLKLAHGYKSKILFSSSSEVYGSPLTNPQNESFWGNVNPVGSRSSYDEGKRATESLFEAYRAEHNVSTYIVRIFNTYGPGMSSHDGRLINSVIVKALRNETITIFGDGKQTRSFMYIDDLVRGLILTMKSSYHDPINLGNPEEFTVYEVVEKILKATNSSSKIIYKEARIDDPPIRRPNVTLAKSVLNWEPKISFNEGIHQTIEYFKKIESMKLNPPERTVLF